MRAILIVFVALMFSGCASVSYNRIAKEPQPKLDQAGSAYILVPANAMYFTKVCRGSGKAIGNLIYSTFSKYFKRVEMAPEGEGLDEGLKKAKNSGFTYLVNSKIFIWEDYVTEWNGRYDQIDMQMDILDVQSSNVLDSVHFKGNGTWFTFGGYHPQHIVKNSIPEYVSSLFPSNMNTEKK